MIYELLHWFANNHNATHLTFSTFDHFLKQKEFVEEDDDIAEFVSKYKDKALLWNIHDYDISPVGYYSLFRENLSEALPYLEGLHGSIEIPQGVEHVEIDNLLAEIQTYFGSGRIYELEFDVNDNNTDYLSVTDYLDKHNPLESPTITPESRVLGVHLYRVDNVTTNGGESMYYRVGLLTPDNLLKMLQAVLTALKLYTEKH